MKVTHFLFNPLYENYKHVLIQDHQYTPENLPFIHGFHQVPITIDIGVVGKLKFNYCGRVDSEAPPEPHYVNVESRVIAISTDRESSITVKGTDNKVYIDGTKIFVCGWFADINEIETLDLIEVWCNKSLLVVMECISDVATFSPKSKNFVLQFWKDRRNQVLTKLSDAKRAIPENERQDVIAKVNATQEMKDLNKTLSDLTDKIRRFDEGGDESFF